MFSGSVHGVRHKEDLPRVAERFRAYWQREIVDRVCLAVTAPREKQVPVPEPESDEQFLTDPDFAVRWYNARMSNTHYGGEALPVANAPGNLLYPAYGGKGSFSSRTVWVDPTVRSPEQWDSYEFDPQNRFIQHTLRVTEALSEDGAGKYLVGSPGVFGCLDAMSLMRGMADFVMELTMPEYAASIRRANQACIEGFKYITKAIYEAASSRQQGQGYVLFMGPLWAPGPITGDCADFSCLIGPKHFRQWMIPELKEVLRQPGFSEFSIYHLDGLDAVRHLPLLLEVAELRAVQFSVGAGHTLEEAIPVYKEIQKAGKLTYVPAEYEQVQMVLQELDPRGLLIVTTAPSIMAAEALLKNAERWTARRYRARNRCL